MAWMFGIAWMSSISGSLMTTFCRLVGFQDYHFGIFTAIAYAATLAQLPAAIYIERTGVRKYSFIWGAAIHRMLWLLIAAVPLAIMPGKAAIWCFLAVYAVSTLLAHYASPPWQTWMGDLIPRRIRGRYFADRSVWTIPVQVVVVMVAGWLLDRATIVYPPPASAQAMLTSMLCLTTNSLGQAMPALAAFPIGLQQGLTQTTLLAGVINPPVLSGLDLMRQQPLLLLPVCAIMAAGAIFGTIDILLFLRLREIVSPPLLAYEPARRTRANPLLALWKKIAQPASLIIGAFKDRVFRHYALYGATVAFSISVCDQYFWLNALENCHFSKMGTNIVFMVIGALSGMLMAKPWGKLIDRWGRRPILILGTIGTIFSPAGWFFIIPDTNHMVVPYLLGAASCVLGGATWTAVGLAQMNIIIGFSDTSGRSRFMAAAAVVAAAGGALGGLAGGFLAQSLNFINPAHPLMVGPFPWVNYHFNFMASIVVRALAIFWLIGMPEPGAKPFGMLMREIWLNIYSNVKFWPARGRQ